MKLDRLAAIALTSAAFAVFGCGCSATASSAGSPAPAAPRTATIYDAYAAQAAQAATVSNAVDTTNLMSAELNESARPAPRVGKAHLAIDESDALDSTDSDENAPKEARRSDGSHRSGSFGTPSK